MTKKIVVWFHDACSHCNNPLIPNDHAFFLTKRDTVVIEGKEYKDASLICLSCWDKHG